MVELTKYRRRKEEQHHILHRSKTAPQATSSEDVKSTASESFMIMMVLTLGERNQLMDMSTDTDIINGVAFITDETRTITIEPRVQLLL